MRNYFAYGSNMSASVMAAACPQHRFLGRARLPGHRLAFTRRSLRTGTGVADAVEDREGVVWGALYELADEDLESLDRKEGAAWAYERKDVRVHANDGSSHDAVVYLVIGKSPEEIVPSSDYLEQLIAAARERALPEDYLDLLRGRRGLIGRPGA